MTLHAIIEYARYRWKAKDRHGVHSPFAYALSEKVLNNTSDSKQHTTNQQKWLSSKYQALLDRVTAYYNYNNIYCLTADDNTTISDQDMFLLKADKPGNWVRLLNKYYTSLSSDGAVLIAGIHKTKRHSAKWRRLYNHPKVMMSFDLYGVGLLFFKKEFKEKQHFVLKY